MKSFACLFLFLALLTACGGGGGTNTTSNETNSHTGAAQGVYQGTTTNGYAFEAVVLPDDKLYAMYGTMSQGYFLVYGMIIGQGTSGASTFSGSYTDYYWDGHTYSGTINANFAAGQSFSGSFSEVANAPATFTGTPLPVSDFNFTTPASLNSVTGTWSGYFLDGSASTVTVQANGSFSGSVSGCSFSGTVTPNSTRNYYTVSVTFGASPCLAPNQTATGIGIYSLLSDGTQELMVGVKNSILGTLFLATRRPS